MHRIDLVLFGERRIQRVINAVEGSLRYYELVVSTMPTAMDKSDSGMPGYDERAGRVTTSRRCRCSCCRQTQLAGREDTVRIICAVGTRNIETSRSPSGRGSKRSSVMCQRRSTPGHPRKFRVPPCMAFSVCCLCYCCRSAGSLRRK